MYVSARLNEMYSNPKRLRPCLLGIQPEFLYLSHGSFLGVLVLVECLQNDFPTRSHIHLIVVRWALSYFYVNDVYIFSEYVVQNWFFCIRKTIPFFLLLLRQCGRMLLPLALFFNPWNGQHHHRWRWTILPWISRRSRRHSQTHNTTTKNSRIIISM